MPDIIINNQGSIILLCPQTEKAKEWLTENCETESHNWFGGNLAVEHRYADAIIEGAQSYGFEVQ